MASTRFPGARLACALSICMSFLSPLPVAAAEPVHPLAWRDADSLPALVEHLETWLDTHTDLPRRQAAPQIRRISAAEAAGAGHTSHSQQGGRVRGLYDPETAEVRLVRPWDMRNPYDVSVLLHELVHHRQAEAGHWYCPGAQELPAYRLQQAWLNGMGLEPDVNWIAVVLEAGCTPRDFHPD